MLDLLLKNVRASSPLGLLKTGCRVGTDVLAGWEGIKNEQTLIR
jgi:hypothetical protein